MRMFSSVFDYLKAERGKITGFFAAQRQAALAR
jgi:hypothetical protein